MCQMHFIKDCVQASIPLCKLNDHSKNLKTLLFLLFIQIKNIDDLIDLKCMLILKENYFCCPTIFGVWPMK
jgi:hypothetical protein